MVTKQLNNQPKTTNMIISNDAERLAKIFSDGSLLPIEYKTWKKK